MAIRGVGHLATESPRPDGRAGVPQHRAGWCSAGGAPYEREDHPVLTFARVFRNKDKRIRSVRVCRSELTQPGSIGCQNLWLGVSRSDTAHRRVFGSADRHDRHKPVLDLQRDGACWQPVIDVVATLSALLGHAAKGDAGCTFNVGDAHPYPNGSKSEY